MFRLFVLSASSLFLLSACASSTFKARQEQREKLAASTGMYCEFVSGDIHPDVDVELSMQMARRCDANRPFSITNYKNSSDAIGIVYCCAMPNAHASQTSKHADTKPASTTTKPTVAPVKGTSGAPALDSNDDVLAE